MDNKRLVEEGEGMVDKWIWRDAMSTIFSVKVTYNYLKGVEQVGFGEFFEDFWKLKTLSSAQVTTWRMLTNTTVTKDNFLQRGIILLSNHCPFCGEQEETVNHLFFECRI